MEQKWRTKLPVQQGKYLVYDGTTYRVVDVMYGETRERLVVALSGWGCENIEEFVKGFPDVLRWLKIECPPSIEKIQAAELASI